MQLDEAHAHEADSVARGDGRDFIEVPCLRGKLYTLGADTVGAWTATRGVLSELLALDPAVRIRQRGDFEAVVASPPALLDAVARVLRPRRRRSLDPARARSIGARTSFSGARGPEDGPGRAGRGQSGEFGRGSVVTPAQDVQKRISGILEDAST